MATCAADRAWPRQWKTQVSGWWSHLVAAARFQSVLAKTRGPICTALLLLFVLAGWGTVLIMLDVTLSLASVVMYIAGTYFPSGVSI